MKKHIAAILPGNMQDLVIDYETLFIRQSPVCGRKEKTTYLRKDFHDRIMKIIQLYNNPKLSVFAYIDVVLEHHFNVYKQDIVDLYENKYEKPF